MLRTDTSIWFDSRRTISDGYVVVVLGGDLGRAPEHVEEELAAATDLDVPLVVVDLDGVTYIGMTGVCALLTAARRIHRRNAGLTLVCSNEAILRVLDMTGVAAHLGVHRSLDRALVPQRRPL